MLKVRMRMKRGWGWRLVVRVRFGVDRNDGEGGG